MNNLQHQDDTEPAGAGTTLETEASGSPPSDDDSRLQRVRVHRDPLENCQTMTPVFVVDESFFRSRTHQHTHWSVAWSDLMMTMFIVFLSLFVYQIAHREFLNEKDPRVVAGSAMPLPPQAPSGEQPFYPIYPVPSDKKADEIKRLKQEDGGIDKPAPQGAAKSEIQPVTRPAEPHDALDKPAEKPQSPPPEQTAPAPGPPQPASRSEEIITDIYDLSRQTLSAENLEKFASIELIPDKTMRIVLTGDLLFDTGKSELTEAAKESLRKLGAIIRTTPYMINVTGHTDSQPMHSALYPTNWELSVARASRVARFLIEDIKIPGTQIIVTGYSYFRPIRPNDTDENRRANRRVEIFLSKLPPDAQPATNDNQE